ncbi:MAG: Flp family type IVb pilin [Actinobacteria bacterium]|nr:MAG: Flp family type IVb pilin [Actinomycetota bacterium]
MAWVRATRSERGASLVEYALLLALIAMVCFAAVSLLGNSTSTKLSDLGGSLSGS